MNPYRGLSVAAETTTCQTPVVTEVAEGYPEDVRNFAMEVIVFPGEITVSYCIPVAPVGEGGFNRRDWYPEMSELVVLKYNA
jgi:hypothetical protein